MRSLRDDSWRRSFWYKTTPIPGVPFDEKLGRFANDDGPDRASLYAVAGRGGGRPARSAPIGPTAI